MASENDIVEKDDRVRLILLKDQSLAMMADGMKTELEIRFGNFDGQRENFVSSTTRPLFDKLFKIVSEEKGFELHEITQLEASASVPYKDWVTRSITAFDQAGKRIGTTLQAKRRVTTIDMKGFGLRAALSVEIDEPKQSEPKFSRYRFMKRYSFEHTGTQSHIDMSIVNGLNSIDFDETKSWLDALRKVSAGFHDADTTYEVEVEISPTIKRDDTFIEHINSLVFKTVLVNINADIMGVVSAKQYMSGLSSILKKNNAQYLSAQAGKGFSQFLNRVVSFQTFHRKVFDGDKWAVTIKTDGQRVLVHTTATTIDVFDNMEKLSVPTEKTEITESIFDAEAYRDGQLLTVYIFDVLVLAGKDMTNEPFRKRLDIVSVTVPLLKSTDKIKFVSKQFCRPVGKKTLFDCVNEALDEKYPFETDGLIFSPLDETYYSKEQSTKWKPPNKNSVDCLVKKIPTKASGKTTYYLFVTMHRREMTKKNLQFPKWYKTIFSDNNFDNPIPYPFVTNTRLDTHIAKLDRNDLDDKICEFFWSTDHWEFMRIRVDKTAAYKRGERQYGNSWMTAQSVWVSIYVAPVDEDQIRGKVPFTDMYFQKKPDDTLEYKAIKMLHRDIKMRLFNRSINSPANLLDIGSGRGNDAQKYIAANVKRVVMTEINQAAIAEFLLERTYKSYGSTTFSILVGNFMELDTQDILARTDGIPFNVIVANFVIHYFISSRDDARLFAVKINSLLGRGGSIIITCFDGKTVMKALSDKPSGESLDFSSDGKVIFSIKRLYSSTKGDMFAKKIGVLLSSISDQYKEENLVDIDALLDLFNTSSPESKWEIDTDMMFQKLAEDKKIGQIPQAVRDFSGMNRAIIMRKI